MMLIPLRQAVFHSDFSRRVAIRPLGHSAPADLHWSHGACFASWGEARADDLIFAMLQIFALLTREAEIPAGRVHRAFCAIPEYRATLLPEHPDALCMEEYLRLKPMLDLPHSLQFQIAG
jgi:hypothetical protein